MKFDWHWHPDPGVIDGIVALSVLYALAVGPARSYLAPEGTPFPRWRAASFALGTFLLFLAVASPLDTISEQYLFSAHMLQHVILIYPVALFWLWGTPGWMLRPFFEMEWSAGLARFLTSPVVAFLTFNLLFYVWHLPALYEWALRDSKIHFLEHATFIGGALLMWWPLLRPVPELPRFHPGGQLLYLLAGSIVQIPLFGILCFSKEALYPTYRTAPRLFGVDAVGDQMLGALLMKLTAMAVMFTALAIVFYRWYLEDRGQVRRRRAQS